MKRAIVMVIDSMGNGAMQDCREFGDVPECNTLKNVAHACNGLNVPNMEKMGLGNLDEYEGIAKEVNPSAQYGTMLEKSNGKDTTTGHWEMAGLVLPQAFQTFTATGFPKEVIDRFIELTGCGDVLANIAASGTAIIEEYNEEHHRTKYPIIYTSADSVYQIAVDIDVIPLETLYDWCAIARKMFDDMGINVSRVIARPYQVVDGKPTRIGKYRRDYVLEPFADTVLNEVQNAKGSVVAIGKIEDIFCKKGVTHAIHTGSNKEGLELTLKAIEGTLNLDEIKIVEGNEFDKSLIFTNLVDTDMLFGHRNDALGYGKAIEEVDRYLTPIMEAMKEDDLLIITADHGCDPTVAGTDHTREHVPVLIYGKKVEPKNLGTITGFDYVAERIREHLLG
ncbi:phosphopentomutase [bacterium]|nr:phosphopentomutase [bacterium]